MAAAAALAMRDASWPVLAQQPQPSTPAAPNPIQSMLAAGATTPVQATKLTDTIYLLQGVGGNMVVQSGPDGKLLIDSSVATAARLVRQAMDKLNARPLKLLINTHWHFDHTSGNASMHDAGAFIIAHQNTRLRLSTPQKIRILNLDFPASSTGGLPQQTFGDREKLYYNNDEIELVHTPDAHTDSDLFVHFANGNVIHTGDLWFNNTYPLIDDGTGGTINGMIQGIDQVLALSDDRTKIVPGHGALGDKTALMKYRAMLALVANRVEKLKIGGQTLAQVVAARPTADLDSAWAHGSIQPDTFVTLVYNTL